VYSRRYYAPTAFSFLFGHVHTRTRTGTRFRSHTHHIHSYTHSLCHSYAHACTHVYRSQPYSFSTAISSSSWPQGVKCLCTRCNDCSVHPCPTHPNISPCPSACAEISCYYTALLSVVGTTLRGTAVYCLLRLHCHHAVGIH
jgi:hypothetical protein